MKRNLLISLAIFVLVLVIFGIWFFFRNGGPGGETSPFSTSQPEGQFEDIDDRITRESADFVQAYWISDEDIFLVSGEGVLLKNDVEVAVQPLGAVDRIYPSRDGRFAIFAFHFIPDSIFSIFDSETENWISLPDGATAVSWHPESSRELVYILKQGENSGLYTFNVESRLENRLLAINVSDPVLHWADSDTILIDNHPSSQTRSLLWRYSVADSSFSLMPQDVLDSFTEWFGDRGVKRYQDGRATILDLSGNESPLSLSVLPHKCTRDPSDTILYCAAPEREEVSVDDYFKGSNISSDNIYVIQFSDSPIGQPLESIFLRSSLLRQGIDAQDLVVKNSRLYFVNRLDHYLYSISTES